MSVTRSIIPMRASTSKPFSRAENGEMSYVTVLAETRGSKSDPEAVLGVLALHRSLRRVGATYPLLCVCVGTSNSTLSQLGRHKVLVREAPPIDHGVRSSNPGAFTTMQVLKLLDYRRLVFLDTDTVVVRNIDHLFSLRSCDFAFAPDIGADVTAARMYKVNSGVFVHAPNPSILSSILEHKDSFAFDNEGGFLQAFINENRGQLDSRINICE